MKLRTMMTLTAAVAATVGSMNVSAEDPLVDAYMVEQARVWKVAEIYASGSKKLHMITAAKATQPSQAANQEGLITPRSQHFNIGGVTFDGGDVSEKGWQDVYNP